MSNSLGSTPFLDEDGLRCFKEVVAESRCYLEYGCGGSTIYCANVARVPTIISVESDEAWIANVREAIGASDVNIVLEHCDIGAVREWGKPKTPEKINDYWMYMSKPWHAARTLDCTVDTILVDGRFRVASFLFSLLSAPVGATILFDDYFDRPKYFIAESFCAIRERRGRMGVFSVTKDFAVPELCEKIAQYSIVPS